MKISQYAVVRSPLWRVAANVLTGVGAIALCFWIATRVAVALEQRTDSAMERYRADRVSVDYPATPRQSDLLALCEGQSFVADSWRDRFTLPRWQRKRIADCTQSALSDAVFPTVAATAKRLAAEALLSLNDQLAALEARARHQNQGTVTDASEALASVRARVTAMQTAVQGVEAPGASLRASIDAQVRAALFARGVQLHVDYAQQPPAARLVPDYNTPAAMVERARRAQQLSGVVPGEPAAILQLVAAVALGMSALVVVAVLLGRAVGPMALIAVLSVLGCATLFDLALGGSPAFRYIVIRQFATWPGTEAASALMPLGAVDTGGYLPWLDAWMRSHYLWSPPLLLALAWLLGASALRWLPAVGAPFEAWVELSRSVRGTVGQALTMTLCATVLLLGLGQPAALSDALILVACIGLATYTVRNAALRSSIPDWEPVGLAIVVVASSIAAGGALLRGDLGHALLALALGALFVAIFGGYVLRIVLLLAGALALVALIAYQTTLQPLAGWLQHAVDALPPHAQDRFLAMLDPFTVSTSDLARTRWLIDSAENAGWGWGNVPWQGIDRQDAGSALPLQAPSDYALSLLAAEVGLPSAVALLLGLVLMLLWCAWRGLRTALSADATIGTRWVAAVGAYGCTAIALKAVLSACGVLGTLPLTGLPVAFIGYGPVNTWASLIYVIFSCGLFSQPVATALHTAAARPRSPLVPAAAWSVGITAVAVSVALAGGMMQFVTAPDEPVHVAQRRHEMTRRIANAIHTVDANSAATTSACPEIRVVVAAWERYLNRPNSEAARPVNSRWALDSAALAQNADCAQTARILSEVLTLDRARVRSSDEHSSHAFHARLEDFVTANRWWGVPGCARWANGEVIAHSGNGGCAIASAGGDPGRAQGQAGASQSTSQIVDAQLRSDLLARIPRAQRESVTEAMFNGKTVAKGRDVTLTLDPAKQALADLAVRCFTAMATGENCQRVLPRDAQWAARYFSSNALRAGAAGVTIIDVDSGAVIAMAGALSECSRAVLHTTHSASASGQHLAALPSGSPCAALPDQHNQWLLSQSPALWMVPPGSAFKGLVALAGVNAGAIRSGDDTRWKEILAESHDQRSVQRVALQQFVAYRGLLQTLGMNGTAADLFWGMAANTDANQAASEVWWRQPIADGAQHLQASAVSADDAIRMRQEKSAGINIDARYGRERVADYLNARRTMDTAVGGGDLRSNTVGLAHAMRWLDLNQRGIQRAPAIHLAQPFRSNDDPIVDNATQQIQLGTAQATGRVLAMLAGVTASASRGTAAGSCRVVFGQCPPQGLLGLSGKTGTADFTVAEDSPWVKPGQQFPTKVFAAVFTSGSRRYAIAAMTLRVRSGASEQLELTSNSAAELALTLIREALPVTGVHTVP